MIPFQGGVPGRQYVKNEPNPVGLKVFVRCGQSGMAYDFEFYQGKCSGVPEDHKDLGLGRSIVMRLVENLPERENFKVYFDNFFTSIPLLIQLKEKGFHALGVLKTNRMPGTILKSKGEMKRQGGDEITVFYLNKVILQLPDGKTITCLTLPLLLLEWVTSIRLNDGAKSIRPT